MEYEEFKKQVDELERLVRAQLGLEPWKPGHLLPAMGKPVLYPEFTAVRVVDEAIFRMYGQTWRDDGEEETFGG